MTTLPTLNDKNIGYALRVLEDIVSNTQDRRAGSKGEEATANILLGEMEKYCDEATEQSFITRPGVGTAIQKALGILLIICVVLFSFSVSTGNIAHATVSLILNLIIFGVFAHKFIFDGTKLDFIKGKKSSVNIFGKRYARSDTEKRVVITAHMDSPLSLRSSAPGQMILALLSLICIITNTLLFCFQLFFLFSGAPTGNLLFDILSVISILFIPLYIFVIFIVDPKRTATGVSSSLVPCSILLSVLKQLSEEGIRYGTTEVCFLFTGSEYSGRAGSYAFARKHRRLFTDVPTVFISLEEITDTEHMCVFFKDGSGTSGSNEEASIIAQSGENLDIQITKETPLLGSSAFTPYARYHFKACSVGSSKKYISKTVSRSSDVTTAVRRKTFENMGSLLLETLNYYDN